MALQNTCALAVKRSPDPRVFQHLYLKVTSQLIFLAGKLPEDIIIAVVTCYSSDLASNGYIYHLKMLPACHLKFSKVLGEHGATRAPALALCVPLPMLLCCTRMRKKKAEGCSFRFHHSRAKLILACGKVMGLRFSIRFALGCL